LYCEKFSIKREELVMLKWFDKFNLIKISLLVFPALLLYSCDFEVIVSKGGRVVSDPAGIDCRYNGGYCIVKNYERLGDSNDAIETKLTAIPDHGYRFSHWSGCDSVELLNCYKNMSGDIQIKAYFTPLEYATSAPNAGSIRFVSLGDFGEGNPEQKMVGDAMAQVCNQLGGCNFVIGLGDNMYDENPQDTQDDAFNRKFEYPYQNVPFPFYMSLGNHDNSLIIDGLGNFNHSGDVQVAYSYREDRLSEKWIMPARYYKHAHPSSAAPLAEFYSLDSNPFMSAFEINPEYFILKYKKEQGDWVRNAIGQSSATWKIAYGHHPFVSNGVHGNAGNYDRIIPVEPITYRLSGEMYRKWLLDNVCGKVDLFVAGHDHEIQLLHSVPECGNTMFIISGAGAYPRAMDDPSRNPVLFQQDNRLGFVISEINGNTLVMKAYSVDVSTGQATLRYQKSFKRRKLG